MRALRHVHIAATLLTLAALPLRAQQIPQPVTSTLPASVLASVPSGTVSATPLGLSLSDAIDRALRYNLAILTSTQDERAAAAQRLEALSDLLPKLSANLSSTQQQINLAAFGFSGFPGIGQVVGPFTIVDGRGVISHSVFDRKLVHDFRETRENERATSFGSENTRELVVLATTSLYLEALAASGRVDAVQAQVARARTLYERAVDMKDAGVVPAIDVLRAQVELQTQQQRLLAFENEFAQQRLNLIRAIGIPLGQEITLTDAMPQGGLPAAAFDDALRTAQQNRPDLKRAESLVRAAQHAVDSARSENLPTLDFDADYGAIGRGVTQSHSTYTVRGAVRVPVFNSNHRKSDREEAEARLEQRRLDSDDLRARVEMEVRSAFLNLRSSEEQVKVAQSSLGLARTQLDQAQDRFEAGVTSNLEVVQAQEAVALADENVISSLYALNIAKAGLARAMGVAEQAIKAYLGARP
jgi:outer membrane protein TolC